jgi:RNA polymerase sigma-70 factor (ECF subfamily)
MHEHAALPTTRWSCVIAAYDVETPDAAAALAELCAGYWYTIYALIRRKGHVSDAALDLTQGYFASLLERRPFADARPFHRRQTCYADGLWTDRRQLRTPHDHGSPSRAEDCRRNWQEHGG